MTAIDRDWMSCAQDLAKRGLGSTATNPSVGCVIVKEGKVLGRGRTGPRGRPHAERQALDDAEKRWGAEVLQGATAYVTLEPCAHTGKTPPCTQALISARITRVVSPFEDPDPRVAGNGFEMLRQAGITVDIGEGRAASLEILRGYLSRVERGRPFLTLKLASTLDGQIATRTGESRWITSANARAHVHLWRAQTDAVLIGVGSALADDPMLNVRLPGLDHARPARVIADTRLQTPLTSHLAQTTNQQDLILLTSENAEESRVAAFEELGASVIKLPMQQSTLSMPEALARLAEIGIGSLLCEGGGRLAASLLRENLVDELVWFTAGATLGSSGAPAISDFGIQSLDDMPRFSQTRVDKVGSDVMTTWQRS